MKKLFKNLVLALVAGALFVSTATSAQSIDPKSLTAYVGKKIVFVTAPGYKPYEYYDNNGQLIGVDLDIYHAICEKLNAKCEMKTVDFEAIVPSVVAGKYDVAIASISVTPERKKVIAYSELIEHGKGAKYLVLAKNFKKAKISSFKQIGAESGTIQFKYIKEKSKAKAVGYSSLSEALLGLKAGRVQAVIADDTVIDAFAKANPETKALDLIVHDPILGEGVALVLNKKSTALLKSINSAIIILKAEGKIAEIYKKWGVTAE